MTGGVVFLLLLAQASASSPPPVVVIDRAQPEQPVEAMSWTCEAMLSQKSARFTLTGQFPAISVEAQKSGDAFRLQAAIRSEQDQRFSGTFPAALTASSSIAGISSYSILIPGTEAGRPKFILRFESFARAKNGFLNILQIDSSSAAPSAYASGICKNEAAK